MKLKIFFAPCGLFRVGLSFDNFWIPDKLRYEEALELIRSKFDPLTHIIRIFYQAKIGGEEEIIDDDQKYATAKQLFQDKIFIDVLPKIFDPASSGPRGEAPSAVVLRPTQSEPDPFQTLLEMGFGNNKEWFTEVLSAVGGDVSEAIAFLQPHNT